jgi:hypothetical protein
MLINSLLGCNTQYHLNLTMAQFGLIGKGGFCIEVIGVSLRLVAKLAPTKCDIHLA